MSGHSSLVSPPVQSGKGFDDFQTRCGSYFDAYRIHPGRHCTDFRWCSNVKFARGLAVGRIQFNSDWSLTQTAEKRGFSVHIPRTGGYEATLDKRQVEVPPGKILLAQTRQLRRIKVHSNDMSPGIALYFDDATVGKALAGLSADMDADRLDVMPVLDLASHVGASLSMIAQTLEAGMCRNGALQRSPKAAVLLIEAALSLILESAPHRDSERPRRRVATVVPRHVRAAIDYMHAHLHQSLTMADIAAVAGVSVRSLQVAFRRFYDTTPMVYLRRLRLEEVHAELSSPGNRLPVSEVALKWGFLHMGRFAAQYRTAYGVYPSETATRAQRVPH